MYFYGNVSNNIMGSVKLSDVKVAFHVRKLRPQNNPPSTVVFDQILTNFGGYWNSVTNSFTVPVRGIICKIFIFLLFFQNSLI